MKALATSMVWTKHGHHDNQSAALRQPTARLDCKDLAVAFTAFWVPAFGHGTFATPILPAQPARWAWMT